MQIQKLKKGMIRKIDDQWITLFNLDGRCEDTFAINPEFAREIQANIKPSEKIFYVIEGNGLLGIGLEEFAPDDLKTLYERMPKETECSYWMNKPAEEKTI